MTDRRTSGRGAGVGRLGTAAAWISAACCLPYLVFKVAWTAGIPLGVADRSVLDSNGWVAANAVMAALQLAGLLLVLALTRPWARRVPSWLLLGPVWVGTGLLFQVVVGAALVAPSARAGSGTISFGGFQPWVFVTVYGAFAGQGVALAIAFGCYVKARWGWLFGERTGDVVARLRAPPARTWLERHLAESAVVVAAMAVAVVVAATWAAGGSVGVSGAEPSGAMQASRVAGAAVCAVGLLGLAGRWGRRTRFWLPAALTWLGSGALVAFDGLVLMLNEAFRLFGAAAPAAWNGTDTLVVVRLVVGILAAAVGALTVAVAANDLDRQHGPKQRHLAHSSS